MICLHCHDMEILGWYMFFECSKIIVCLEVNSTWLQTVAYSEYHLHIDIYILTIFQINQLAIYVLLVLLLSYWFITNMADKGLVEKLCICLLLSKPKSYFQHPFVFISRLSHWDWKVSPDLSTFGTLIFIRDKQ